MPQIVVLSPEGKVLGVLDGASIKATESKDLPRCIREFLDSHEPQRKDARTELQAAIQQAASGNRHLIVQVTGPACRPCLLMSQFFDEHWTLFERDFHYVKIDERDSNAHDVMTELGYGVNGIPWTAILDSTGHVVATSDGPQGNIGFPSSPAGIQHFIAMLKPSAKHMSDADFERLREVLSKP